MGLPGRSRYARRNSDASLDGDHRHAAIGKRRCGAMVPAAGPKTTDLPGSTVSGPRGRPSAAGRPSVETADRLRLTMVERQQAVEARLFDGVMDGARCAAELQQAARLLGQLGYHHQAVKAGAAHRVELIEVDQDLGVAAARQSGQLV